MNKQSVATVVSAVAFITILTVGLVYLFMKVEKQEN